MEAGLLLKIHGWLAETENLHVTALVFDGLHVSKKKRDGSFVELKKREQKFVCAMLHKRALEECNIDIYFS
eukprot:4027939-Pleurochrysis_carterae.AAC.1